MAEWKPGRRPGTLISSMSREEFEQLAGKPLKEIPNLVDEARKRRERASDATRLPRRAALVASPTESRGPRGEELK
jgi:hypothetical protein